MLRKLLSTLLLCAVSSPALCQSVSEIKKSSEYYWGEGVGETTSKAEKYALDMLINNISSSVESSFTVSTSQKDGKTKKDSEFTQEVAGIVKTHSKAVIKNTEILSWGEEPDIHVFRYVRKLEINKIFDERKNKIFNFIDEGLECESRVQIADALRNYYWALMLLQSMPNATEIRKEISGTKEKLDIYLPKKIREVIRSLKMSVTRRLCETNLTIYTLNILYNGNPVSNLDYSYSDGRNWSIPVSAKDGTGIVEMAGDTSMHQSIRVRIEYAFENEWKTDAEIADVLSKLELIPIRESYLNVDLSTLHANINVQNNKTDNPASNPSSNTASNKINNNIPQNLSTLPNNTQKEIVQADGTAYNTLLQRVAKSIRSRNYESVRNDFTEDGYKMFESLVKYGNAVIIEEPNYSFYLHNDEVQARSLKLKFSFKSNRKTFVEDIVFSINPAEKKIISLSFGLSKQVFDEIANNSVWNDFAKMSIISFIENYKTAYALKRLDYISSIFSEDALIIVGRIIKNNLSGEMAKYANVPKVEYSRLSKEQYIKNLGNTFKSNEYVNLRFQDISVVKAGKGGEIYGLQLEQDYYSTSYGDHGYLFLIVDLNNKALPTIHVRTWQPEKDADFGVYNLGMF